MNREKLELALAQYKDWQENIKGAEKIATFEETKKAYRYEASIHDIAIECIGRQIPKKPKKVTFVREGKDYDGYACPCCIKEDESKATPVGLKNDNGYKMPFCYLCGQAIDWSRDEQ